MTSVTRQQQLRQHKYTPILRVSCSAGASSCILRYCCFRLISTLIASHGVWKPKSGCLFRIRFILKLDPFFSGGGRPENDIRTCKPENRHFRVCKICKMVLRPENVHFRIQKRVCRRWLHCHTDTRRRWLHCHTDTRM